MYDKTLTPWSKNQKKLSECRNISFIPRSVGLTVKMVILSKVLYRFNTNPVKFSTLFYIDIVQLFKETQKPGIALKIWIINSRNITIPDIKWYYRAIGIQIEWQWPRNRHVDYWNQTEVTYVNPHTYGHWVFITKPEIFNKWCRSNRMAAYRRI